MKTILPSRALPGNTRARVQHLLDEGDRSWFARNPTATHRVRFHFRNEQVEAGRSAQRYVRVTVEGDRLIRRFTGEEATA